jgi:hypothetical protein
MRAANFVCDGNLLSFVDASVGAGPLNVVLDDLGVLDGQRVRVNGKLLQIGEAEFTLDDARRYDSAISIPEETTRASVNAGLALFKCALREFAPPRSLISLHDKARTGGGQSDFEAAAAARFAEGCRLLREGLWSEGVRNIRGLGWGLTPGGDDFLCGLLIALHLRQRLFGEDTTSVIEEVYQSARSDNLFSAAYLRCAKEGRVFQTLKCALAAILRTDSREIAEGVERLASLGATSGSDLAAGLLFGLEKRESLHKQAART